MDKYTTFNSLKYGSTVRVCFRRIVTQTEEYTAQIPINRYLEILKLSAANDAYDTSDLEINLQDYCLDYGEFAVGSWESFDEELEYDLQDTLEEYWYEVNGCGEKEPETAE